jgi:hypothetical protein
MMSMGSDDVQTSPDKPHDKDDTYVPDFGG